MASKSGFDGRSDTFAPKSTAFKRSKTATGFCIKVLLSFQNLRWCLAITSNRFFDYVIGVIILINSLLVGAEVELSLQDIVLPWMQPLDTAFIAVYCVEIAMRLVGSGWRACFADGWFLLDFILVVVGVITTLALQIPGQKQFSVKCQAEIAAICSKKFSKILKMY